MRIVLILPCCIGDVVMATAVLRALRRAYPDAHLTWAVGTWSRAAVEHHPDVNAIMDTGAAPLPVKSIGGFMNFVRRVRRERFDMAVSLVRSPLMSAALMVSGVRVRAGLNSNGRGFGYTVRARIDPDVPRHEGEIYLDVPRALGLDVTGCYANLPVRDADRQSVRENVTVPRYIVMNPAGGRNPGMVMDVKRYPPEQMAELGNRLSEYYALPLVLIGAKTDRPILDAVISDLRAPHQVFAGELSFGQIGALAADSFGYVGNDTGLTHLAAASGARTVMILGPTDPARYAPFVPPDHALALWKPAAVSERGVAGALPLEWDWKRDGIGVDEAYRRITAFWGTP